MRIARLALLASAFLFFPSVGPAQSSSHAPASTSAQRQAAIALEQQGRLPEAEQAWRAIARANPRNAEAYAHLGLLAARREDYEKAISLYRKALALGPALPGLRMNLGLALFKGAHSKEAIREFTTLLHDPKTPPPQALRLRILIGMAHYGEGEYADAIPFLKEAAAADPHNLPLRLVLAHTCLWAKQNQCVLDTYREILTIDPDSAEAYVLAGEAMDAEKNTTGAIEQFRLALKANPRLPMAHFGLGYLLWTQKAYDEAARELQAELDLNPDYPQALLYLADIDVKAGRFEQARPLLERAEKAEPTLSLAHLDLGIVLSEAGQNQDAVKELKEAVRLDPSDTDSHWRLARIYRTLGDTDAAEKEFAKTRELKEAMHEDLYQKLAHGQPQKPEAEIPFTPSAPQQ